MPPPWAHTHALADELHEALRLCVDQALAEAVVSPDAVLAVDRVRRKLESAVSHARIPELQALVDAQSAIAGEATLDQLQHRHPDKRLKDLIETLQPYRVQKLVRARLEQRKQSDVIDAIRSERITWAARVKSEEGVGIGLDERAIELPLAFETARFGEPGRVLDAGAALNRGFLRGLIDPPVAELTHFTQSGDHEEARFAGSRVSYVFGDLRSMPFPDCHFDRIVCISTLEHVGMDNARYGASSEQGPASAVVPIRELTRVLAPGGTLLVTVPYGPPALCGWFRVFGPADVNEVLEAARPADAEARYFRFSGSWASSDGAVDAIPPHRDGICTVNGIAAIRIVKRAAG
jgi:SAM-dependent methyltransferase